MCVVCYLLLSVVRCCCLSYANRLSCGVVVSMFVRGCSLVVPCGCLRFVVSSMFDGCCSVVRC